MTLQNAVAGALSLAMAKPQLPSARAAEFIIDDPFEPLNW